MSDERSADERAREMIDRSLYMVLGTADRDGRPWASSVYYAPSGYREFLWISDPDPRRARQPASGQPLTRPVCRKRLCYGVDRSTCKIFRFLPAVRVTGFRREITGPT
jgi:Pyridoxamine 5'-phosphate oxidase